MKIGIVGTRGIPNQYGGFEQFVEYIAPELVQRGHEVFVYNSSLHPYKENIWKDVHLIRKFDPENRLGTAGQFIYDLNCILDSRKRKYDVILQLGYTSSSIWSFLFPRKSVLVTNMDGLEWKRSKYSKPVQRFLKHAERWAVVHSDTLVADSKGIQEYLQNKYNKPSAYIAYGASLFQNPSDEIIKQYNLKKFSYNIAIARMEPENNIETIMKGHRDAAFSDPLIIIGGYTNRHGRYLKEKYESERILFLGPVYNIEILNNLRYYSKLYFHGHSVGGTNPSLLEAMASGCLVAAHDNIFNKSILEEDAFYFTDPLSIVELLNTIITKDDYRKCIANNLRKIGELYSWKHIANQLEECLLKSLEKK